MISKTITKDYILNDLMYELTARVSISLVHNQLEITSIDYETIVVTNEDNVSINLPNTDYVPASVIKLFDEYIQEKALEDIYESDFK